jgi:hypothetical protein
VSDQELEAEMERLSYRIFRDVASAAVLPPLGALDADIGLLISAGLTGKRLGRRWSVVSAPAKR